MPKKRQKRNPGKGDGYDGAVAVAEGFHGRPTHEEIDIAEKVTYDKELAQLGLLCEMELLTDLNTDEVTPLCFEYDGVKDPIRLCGSTDRNRLLLVGGDQDLEDACYELGFEEGHLTKRSVVLGEIFSISYFADKHHLQGGEDQKNGVEYQHEFGEEGGRLPVLVYHPLDREMEIVGGEYEIRDEGIWN